MSSTSRTRMSVANAYVAVDNWDREPAQFESCVRAISSVCVVPCALLSVVFAIHSCTYDRLLWTTHE
jgi:hypothetical protein